MQDPAVLFSHIRKTRSEGIRVAVTSAAVAIVLLYFGSIIFTETSLSDQIFYWIFVGMTVLAATLGVFLFKIPNILSDKEFSLTIYQDRVICASPFKLFAPASSIMLDEIKNIIDEPSGVDVHNWYIITTDGRRGKITYSYNKPAAKIAKILLDLKYEDQKKSN